MRSGKGSASKLILALDLSLSATGWAVIDVTGDVITLIDCGEIRTSPRQTHGERLRVIRRELSALCRKYDFDIVVKERGFSRFPKETQALFKTHGIAEEYFAEFTLYDYAPSTVKKTVTGSGRATKAEVEKAVRKLLNLSNSFLFKSNDVSDAAAVGLTHILKGA